MVEGGAQLARSFLEAGWSTNSTCSGRPAVIGPAGVDALAGLAIDRALLPFGVREQEKLGSDVLTVYEARTN